MAFMNRDAWDKTMEQWHTTTEENCPCEPVLVLLGSGTMIVAENYTCEGEIVWYSELLQCGQSIEASYWRHLPKGPQLT